MTWEVIAGFFAGILTGILGMAFYLAHLLNKFKADIKCKDNDCDADWWKTGQKPPY